MGGLNWIVNVRVEGCVSMDGDVCFLPFTQCDVVRAGFKENITLTLDGQTGHLIR